MFTTNNILTQVTSENTKRGRDGDRDVQRRQKRGEMSAEENWGENDS